MDRRTFLTAAGGIAGCVTMRASGQEDSLVDMSQEIEAIRERHNLPGMAAAAVRRNRRVAEGVAGVRRVGENTQIAADDRFGMASCTKVMTATMALRLIDAGKMMFETALAEALPDVPMRDEYRGVTVADLLLFRGGIQPYMQFINPDGTPLLLGFEGTAREQRAQFVRQVLLEEPVVKPGTERRYSNASYAIAGYVADRRSGKSWEVLMEEEVFQPLGMKTAAFGRPRNEGRMNEPTLYELRGEEYVAEADEQANAGELLAPAGNVCCSIRDFAKFAAYELNAEMGKDALLSAATRARWQELSRTAGPLTTSGKLTKSKGPKASKAKGPGEAKLSGEAKTQGDGPRLVGGPNARDGRSFFGGSNFVSSGCILWPSLNLAIVAAVNAGGGHEAIRAVFDLVKGREGELAK